MLTLTNAQASTAILKAVAEKSLIKGAWHSIVDGRDCSCLLGSMHPEVNSMRDCNGDLMPLWMAGATMTLFDRLRDDEIYSIALRYGFLIGRWQTLSSGQWDAIFHKFVVWATTTPSDRSHPVAGAEPATIDTRALAALCHIAIQSGDRYAAAAWIAAAAVAAVLGIAQDAFVFLLDEIDRAVGRRDGA